MLVAGQRSDAAILGVLTDLGDPKLEQLQIAPLTPGEPWCQSCALAASRSKTG
jgi:hypothetical protein